MVAASTEGTDEVRHSRTVSSTAGEGRGEKACVAPGAKHDIPPLKKKKSASGLRDPPSPKLDSLCFNRDITSLVVVVGGGRN